MRLIQNGVIIQGLSRPTNFMTRVEYLGINSYYHSPLTKISAPECKSISDEVFSKKLDDGYYQILEFISDEELFKRYVGLCKRHSVEIRALFIESEYSFERWEGDMPPCRFIGYEYCEIPFDAQMITDFAWHEPLFAFYDRLNEYGLFDSLADAESYKRKYDEEFEKGAIGDGEMDTFICRVYEIDLDAYEMF